jgi:ubiquitin-protein ligase
MTDLASSANIKTINDYCVDINAWCSQKNIDMSLTFDKKIIINFGNDLIFGIICPDQSQKYFLLENLSKTHRFDWVDNLNLISIKSNVSLDKIMEVIQKKITGLTKNTDLELSIKKKELEKYLENSRSPITQLSSSNKTKLFDKTTLGMIIIDEFMDVYKNALLDPKINITLVNNNIYHWKICFSKFNNKIVTNKLQQLKAKYNYDYIELDIMFHDVLYPNYPPIIKVIRPRLNNSLMHKIANLKMVQLDYWNNSRSIKYIVDRMHIILDKKIDIDVDSVLNDKIKYTNGAYNALEPHLVKLASYISLDNKDNDNSDIDDVKYEKTNNFDKSKQSKRDNTQNKKSNNFTKGTGYGSSGSAEWNIDAYLKSQEENDIQIKNILNNIVTEIQTTKENISSSIKDSFLIKYIKSLLTGTTLLQMSKQNELYKTIFTLLQNFANENNISLFHDDSPKDLFAILCEVNKLVETASKFNSSDELLSMISVVYNMAKPCYETYTKSIKTNNIVSQIIEKKTNTQEEKYVEALKDMKFDTCKIVDTNYHYQSTFNQNKGQKVSYQKRLVQEFSTLEQAITIKYDASVFVRVDNDNMSVIRTLMTGPKDTPYDSGCFIFDTYIIPEFPNTSPKVWYLNTGGVRFNPNLYAEGKVCLSLLGTWQGDNGAESWNPKISTLFQVYMSIQSLILVDHPYFNEPGYERDFGTPRGNALSKSYNYNIRYYTMCHAMRDLLQNPDSYPQFTDVIKKHFYYKKERVLEICSKWTYEADLIVNDPSSGIYTKHNYKSVLTEIEMLLNKLTLS